MLRERDLLNSTYDDPRAFEQAVGGELREVARARQSLARPAPTLRLPQYQWRCVLAAGRASRSRTMQPPG
jgi:hypothetical protein